MARHSRTDVSWLVLSRRVLRWQVFGLSTDTPGYLLYVPRCSLTCLAVSPFPAVAILQRLRHLG